MILVQIIRMGVIRLHPLSLARSVSRTDQNGRSIGSPLRVKHQESYIPEIYHYRQINTPNQEGIFVGVDPLSESELNTILVAHGTFLLLLLGLLGDSSKKVGRVGFEPTTLGLPATSVFTATL